MTKKLLSLLVLVSLMVALMAATVASKAWFDPRNRVTSDISDRVTKYSFPKVASKPVAWGDVPDQAEAITSYPYAGRSLGAAAAPAAVESPGFPVIISYNDDQLFPGGNHQVDFRGPAPSVHFVYGWASGPLVNGLIGYNVYDPTGAGDWPRGAGVGCLINATDEEGLWPNMAVSPAGYVVIGAVDNAGGSRDNHFYSQPSQHSCFFGAGCLILPTQYNATFLTPANYLGHPRIEIQEFGGDTIVHCIAVESEFTVTHAGNPFDIRGNTINYFRKFGEKMDATCAWEGPFLIDIMNSSSGVQDISNGSIAASRVSGKVAVAYTKQHALGIVENQRYDVEVYFRTSTNAGATWGPQTNMTNYSRILPSQTAFINTHSIYDSEDYLHIIWTADQTVENVYDDPIYFWGDFSASLYHWSDRVPGPNAGGTIVRAHNANWGIAYNTQVCGFGAPGVSYIGYESIAECNGRLYCFFSQWLDAWGIFGPAQVDDCASGFTDRYYAANGEAAMVVSSSLDGLLWDAARNLSKSYTPGCDSAGYGGVCMNDSRITVSRYGMDSAAYGQALTWPGDELVVPDNGTWTDPYYLHVFYTEDHYPGPGWRDPETYNMTTPNPLKWMRIPCVEPIEAPQIILSADTIGYPDYVQHGDTTLETIIVTNDGNVPLTVDSIKAFETSAPSGWLGITKTDMTVGAGVLNTETFGIIINSGGIVNAPGTIVALNGEVSVWSDAANRDSTGVVIQYIVADTVVGMEWDTLSTYTGGGTDDFVQLVLANTGGMGQNGLTSVNLDYTESGNECDAVATVYLYSGGPLAMRRDIVDTDTSFVMSYSMHQANFATDISFKPVHDRASPAPIAGTNFDGWFSGTFVNRDTTIAAECEWYAPTGGADSSDFVIVRTRFFSYDGNPHENMVFGEVIDWDIVAVNGTGDQSGALPEYNTVYQQGTDTTTTPCQPNNNRFGASMLLGYYTNEEFNTDPCAGVCTPYGVYSARNDSDIFVTDTFPDGSTRRDGNLYPPMLWEKTDTLAGIHAIDEVDDLHTVSTWLHDWTLGGTDTLEVYSVVTSVHNGTVVDLKANLDAAFEWYRVNLRDGCEDVCGCCKNVVGNVDGDPGEVVDIGDLTALIDYLFITKPAPVLPCPEEANIDADPAGVIDIGDLTALIDYLFITKPAPPLNPC
ncbi:MAG TPA: hypothetical protein VMY05_00725 [Acidobacteriota bacterium]|nr:hypothetical protein [Acidobacteriota bacterium]